MQYKDLTTNLIKKYLKTIFPDENTFNKLFKSQIRTVLQKLKNNEKFKDKEIVCRNFSKCIGSQNGVYKLLSVEPFKYQILTEEKIPYSFICHACLNNIPTYKNNFITP